MRVQPRITLSGVRSSWDSVARNSSFSRLDSRSPRSVRSWVRSVTTTATVRTPSMVKAMDDSCAGFQAPASVSKLDVRPIRFRAQHPLQRGAGRRRGGTLPKTRPAMRSGGARHQLGETLVAIQDRPIRAERQRTLAHLFDHQAIGLVGTAQRVDLLALRGTDDERIDMPRHGWR